MNEPQNPEVDEINITANDIIAEQRKVIENLMFENVQINALYKKAVEVSKDLRRQLNDLS